MFGIIAPIVGAAVGIYGANKQANAAKDAQQSRNDATNAQYKYDVEAWQMQKDAAIAKRDYAVREVEMKAEAEGRLAAYKDATAARQYNYNLQIRNSQQDANDRMFQKSEDIYLHQTSLNSMNEKAARMDERRQLKEIEAENRYEKNEVFLDALLAEGAIRARGVTGRSADKARSVSTLKAGVALTQLSSSLENATVASNSAIRAIGRERSIADLNAYASKMLDPGELPMPIAPLATPQAQFMYPRVFQDYDFGPQPIQGAMISPSAAAAQVWGTSIGSLAGAASQITASAIPKIFG